MQIVKLELKHYNFFCPATGEQILSEEYCNDDAKSLQGYWLDEFIDEPVIKNKTLAKDWKTFQKKNQDPVENSSDLLRSFFTNYQKSDWVVFELTNKGDNMGLTVWKVLDLNTEK